MEAAGRALRQGGLTCTALVREALLRVQALQPRTNAFITVTEDAALARAAQLDAELRAGRDRGPLHGIPFAFKDCFDTAGVRTTIGSKYFAERVPRADAAVVRRLAAAGAVMLGKANMNEFAAGTSGKNAFYGDVRNPWSPERSAGGSSSGTAAALAGGMVLGGIGTDCGGSIRLPAACTGIVGLRPTLGLVATEGVYPRCFAFDVAGPLARSVRDCALILTAMAGTGEDYLAGIEGGTRGVRIGVVRDFSLSGVDADIAGALRRAIGDLGAAGAQVLEVTAPALVGAADPAAFFDILLYEFHGILGGAFRASTDPQGTFGPVVRDNLRRGARVEEATYRSALAERDALKASVERILRDVDALLTPAMPAETPRLDAPAGAYDSQRRFMAPFSMSGLPAIVLPCGIGASGLPLGMQLVAGPRNERLLFRIARAYEAVTGWHTRWPT